MENKGLDYKELNKSVVGSNAFLMVNKKLMALFGIKATVYLSTLIFKEDFFKERMDKNGYFWNTQEDIEESCLLSPNEQSESLKILKANGIVDFEKIGLPARNHFKINHEKIFYILSSNSLVIKRILTGDMTHIDLPINDLSHNNIEYNNIENNKKEFSSKEENKGFDESKPPIVVFVKKLNRRAIIANQFINNNPFKIDRQKMKEDLLTLNPPKEVKPVKTTPEVEEILNHWSGLNLFVSKESTDTYREGIRKLKGLLDGALFNQKYSVEEIKQSISRFYIAVSDIAYKPMEKKLLKSINLNGFISNKFVKGDAESYFKKYLNENQPEPIIAKKENKHPNIVNQLRRRYQSEVNGGLRSADSEKTIQTDNQFIDASIKLIDFWNKNKSRIMGNYSDSEKANCLFDAVKLSVNGDLHKISPGWFCSEKMFADRLPKYLNKEGIINDDQENSSGFNIYGNQKKSYPRDQDIDYGL